MRTDRTRWISSGLFAGGLSEALPERPFLRGNPQAQMVLNEPKQGRHITDQEEKI
jgi:hypothetical protein